MAIKQKFGGFLLLAIVLCGNLSKTAKLLFSPCYFCRESFALNIEAKFLRLRYIFSGKNKCTNVFTTEIEGFKQNVHTNRSGDYTHSECCLLLRGEKFRVKDKDFFKFGEGDLVTIEAARQSKYVFSVEKIRH